MMLSPVPVPPPKRNIEADLLSSVHNIPTNFDMTVHEPATNEYFTPNPTKQIDSTLLTSTMPRRFSISTISTLPSRNPSPCPQQPSAFKTKCYSFWKRNEGPFLVTFSQLFGALMNVAARLLELEGDGMDPLQILFARMSLTFVFCCAWMWWKKVPDFPWGAKGIRLLLVMRGFTGFFGIYGMYYSLQYLPVADAVVITFLAPSVASYGCYLFLKEPFPRSAQYASLISLLGVTLIARPTSLFTSPSPPEIPVYTNTTSISTGPNFPIPTSTQRLSAVAVAMLGVFGTAGAFTTIRWIGPQAHPLLSVNYFAVLCTLISSTSLLLAPLISPTSHTTFALPASLRQWSMLFFLGICGFVMQFLITKGLAVGGRGNGARATNMIYTNMLFALALDKLIFGQSPGWWSLGGSGMILGSAVFVALKKGNEEEVVGDGDQEMSGVGARLGRDGGSEEERMGILRLEGGMDLDVDVEEQGARLERLGDLRNG